MQERRSLSEATQPAGVIVRRARGRLLRDIPCSDRPRTRPNFGPVEIWQADEEFNWLDGARPKVLVKRLTWGSVTANEVQSLTISDEPTGGTFTVGFADDTPVVLNFDDDASTIQTALESLPSIGTGNITCSGGPINTREVVCTFGGSLANAAQSLLITTTSLTPCEIYPITGMTTGVNGRITIASTNDSLFRDFDRFAIIGSSAVSGADDGINNCTGTCRLTSSVSSGVLTIYTDRPLSAAADLGSVIRLTPPMQLRGRIYQAVNRWSDAYFDRNMIVVLEQEAGSEWWDIVDASRCPYVES